MRLTNPWLGLILAILHTLAGVSILLVSSWFIAACALAGVSFNYMLPAVVIRGLAILRIASGYASMWLSHNALLTRLANIRLGIFKGLESARFNTEATAIDRLIHQSEDVAALWASWLAGLAGTAITLLLVSVSTIYLLPSLTSYWLAFIFAYLGIYAVLIIKGLGWAEQLVKVRAELQSEIQHHANSASIWHMTAQLNHPDISVFSQKVRQNQNAVEWAMTGLLGCALIILTALVYSLPEPLVGQPLTLLVPMLLLSANDWLGRSFENQPAFLQYLQSRKQLKQFNLEHDLLPRIKDKIHAIELKRFKAKDTRMPNVNLALDKPGILLLQGSSGVGKSRLLMALSGLIDFQGERQLNHKSSHQGVLDDVVYTEQFPTVLAGSLRNNLHTANPAASDALLQEVLQKVGLNKLTDLNEWVGDKGRKLSGGEKKKLGIARACLSNKSVLLLDEPFEALDDASQNQLCTVIKELAQKRILVIASHIVPSHLHFTNFINLDTHNNS